MSASSQPQPLSTAYYYDPHARCIKCDPALAQVGDDGTIILNGIVVEVTDDRGNIIPSSSFHLQPGKELMGEIVEIIDLDEMDSSGGEVGDRVPQPGPSAITVASATATAGGVLTPSFLELALRLTQEAEDDSFPDISQLLLQKQCQLQSLHAQQYQLLLHKQKKDWLWFNQQHLGEKRLLELEAIHQRESMELQSRQQKEQNEMLDFVIFKCIPLMKSRGQEHREQARVAQTSTSTQTETIVPSSSVSTPTKTIVASSSVSTQTDPIIEGLDTPPPPSSSATFLPDRISTDRQRADEIKAVMRDRYMSRDERQKKLAEIKERFTISSVVPTILTSEKKTTVKIINGGQGHEGPVKDVSLMKEVKQETVAKIAPISGFRHPDHSGPKSGQGGNEAPKSAQDRDGEAPKTAGPSRWNAMVSGAGPSRKPDDVAKDDSDSSVEAGTRDLVNDDGCRDDDQEQSKLSSGYQKASMRWNMAAVKVGTNNLVARSIGGPDASSSAVKEDERPKPSSGDQKASMRVNTAAVKVGRTNLVARSIGCPDSSRIAVKKDTGDYNRPFTAGDKVETSVMDSKSNHDVPDDPLDIATDRIPMKKLIKRLKNNDPSLAVLKLDGRKQIKQDDWQSLFESLEGNSSLTHLSISRCEINDSICIALVLALVENAALVDIRLNNNRGLTDDTGKGLIKILSTNSSLRNVGVARTSLSKNVVHELDSILGKRNSHKRYKIQDERQEKFKELISFSFAGSGLAAEASAAEDDELSNSPSSRMLATRASSKKSLISKGSTRPKESSRRPSISKGKSNSSLIGKGSKSRRPSISKGKSNSSLISKGSNTPKETSRRPSVPKGKSNSSNEDKNTENGRRPSMSKEKSNSSNEDKKIENELLPQRGSIDSLVRGSVTGPAAQNGRLPRRESNDSLRRGSVRGPAAHRQSLLRASVTARTMAQLGEDITNVGVDMSKLREQRKFRGECDTCGRKCYTKTLFKSIPLTIPNMVENGLCLKCNP